jgi:hypothetical protein
LKVFLPVHGEAGGGENGAIETETGGEMPKWKGGGTKNAASEDAAVRVRKW